jgi:hypothetical protein
MVLAGIVWLAALLWGIYKYAALAQEPLVNGKCARSLAVAFGGWAIAVLASFFKNVSTGPLSPEGGFAYMVALTVAQLVAALAIVVAVLGLRELARIRVPGELDPLRGRALATWAIVVSALLIVPRVIVAAVGGTGAPAVEARKKR